MDRAGDHRARLASLRSLLDRRGDAAALLTTRRNFAWLTAGGIGHVLQSMETSIAAILVTRDDIVVITQNIEAARLSEEELEGLDVEVVSVPWWESGAIEAEAFRRLPASVRVANDAELEVDLTRIRSVLSPTDRDRLGHLGRIARDAMDATIATIRPGMSEDDAVAQLSAGLPGVRTPVVLAAADERIASYRHPLPGETRIRTRMMLVIVVERWGLHVALTRIRELEAPTGDLARRIDAVRAVQAAMHAATRPGATFGDVFAVAQVAYADAGFPDEWRDHHQGGSIGYQPRERVAVPDDPTPIESGMAFAWNPSIAGAKAEDTIVIDERATRMVTAG